MFVNQSLADLIGYPVDKLIGMNLREITTKEQFKIFQQKTILRKKGTKDSYEAIVIHKNGKILNVIISAAPFNTPDRKFGGTFAMVTDITKMKEVAEKAEFYHSLLRHDIGNKNQIIMRYLELIMDTKLDKEQKELTKMAYGAIKSSNELIKKVKEMQMVAEEHEYSRINLDSILRKIIEGFSSELRKRSIRMQYKPIKLDVMGDELVGEVFSNIIGNAIIHSGGKNINISGKAKDGYVVVLVEDDGTGIPEYIRNDIFDKKVKGKGSQGSGLGLYLVRAVVDSYGGKVEVKSGEKGIIFEIYLKKWGR